MLRVIKMTQQFGRLTAEDLDCYRELFSGITKKIQRFCYSNFYIFDVEKNNSDSKNLSPMVNSTRRSRF